MDERDKERRQEDEERLQGGRDAEMEQDEDKKDEGEEGCPPLFLTSKGFITLLSDNSSWRSSVKSRPLRYPSASRITMPFTVVSLYPNSNPPLHVTLGSTRAQQQPHNGSHS